MAIDEKAIQQLRNTVHEMGNPVKVSGPNRPCATIWINQLTSEYGSMPPQVMLAMDEDDLSVILYALWSAAEAWTPGGGPDLSTSARLLLGRLGDELDVEVNNDSQS